MRYNLAVDKEIILLVGDKSTVAEMILVDWTFFGSLGLSSLSLPLMEADDWYAALCSMKRSLVSKREFF